MPKDPRDEKHPADMIGAAVKVMRIATGEEEDKQGADDQCCSSAWEAKQILAG